MAVNSAIFMAPFAPKVFAGDESWWRLHDPFLGWFKGDRYTICSNAARYEAMRLPRSGKPADDRVFGNNSGVQAISLAIMFGAQRILLLGFDCRWQPGRAHCHGDHPERLADGTRGVSNPQTAEGWIDEHERLADAFGDRIINCTRDTALDCYRRMSLSEAIHGN